MLSKEEKAYWDKSSQVFRKACLLHDFGHAPFSHAGEAFYDDAADPKLNDALAKLVDDEEFSRDCKDGYSAANHEIMSAILAIEKFGNDLGDIDLFARCITGYTRKNPSEITGQIDNIFVSLLNSNTIDVDRLDYLIRDAFVVGYDSISLDYQRLLGSLSIAKYQGEYQLVYGKSALSVLENVIYGRDLEKKWIQAHPVVLYEQILVKHIIRVVVERFRSGSSSLFSKEALTNSGIRSDDGQKVRLLSDDDVIFLAKNNYCDARIDEYFSRGSRMHPIWKSEAEFDRLFPDKSERREGIELLLEELDLLVSYVEGTGRDPILDEELLSLMRDQYDKYHSRRDGKLNDREQAKAFKNHIKLLEELKSYSKEHSIAFEYTILQPKRFASGFSSGDLGKLRIDFGDGLTSAFGDVSGCLTSNTKDSNVFFLYHRDASGNGFPSRKEFADFLIDLYL